MRSLAAVAVALALAACAPSVPAARPSPRITPLPASPLPPPPDPAAIAPSAAEAGLPLVAGADGITAEGAAGPLSDEVTALTLYDSWGWVSESTRRFAAGPRSLDVTILLTQSPDGGALAFAYLAEQAAAAPLAAGACPAALSAFEDCTQGAGGGAALVVGRSAAVVVTVRGTAVDPVPLAALIAARI